jgi:hypothetical protein
LRRHVAKAERYGRGAGKYHADVAFAALLFMLSAMMRTGRRVYW